MARPKGSFKVPAYRLHKASGQAIVRTPDGATHYLGRHGAPESWDKYQRIVGEFFATGGQAAVVSRDRAKVTIAQAVAAWVEQNKDRRSPQDMRNFRAALRPLKQMYGTLPASEFGPMNLRAVRETLIRTKVPPLNNRTYSRKYVNQGVNRIRLVLDWAIGNEVIDASTKLMALKKVPHLKPGEGGVREGREVKPVEWDHVAAVLPYVSAQVAAIIRLQWLTGARSGEICMMRTGDIDRSDPQAWVYRPARHKSQHKGFARTIFLGPQAQEILKTWLRLDPNAHLFSPGDAERARRDAISDRARVEWPAELAPRADGRVYCPHCHAGFRYKRWLIDHLAREHGEKALAARCDRVMRYTGTRRTQRWRNSRNAARRKGKEAKAFYQDCYNCHTLRSAVDYGIERVNRDRAKQGLDPIPRWHPHMIRHSAGTRFRKEFGLETARVLLGHQRTQTTEIYAERDNSVAINAIAKVG